MLRGGCYCGAVRYEAGGTPLHETNCHCTICRRTSGAPYVAWFTVALSQFRFTAGSPARFKSSADCTRSFCSACGTPLTFQSGTEAQWIDVTTCSLDQPERVPPRDHTWVESKLPWTETGDALPAYPRGRGG